MESGNTEQDKDRWYLPPRLIWVRAGIWICSIVGGVAIVSTRLFFGVGSAVGWWGLVMGVGGACVGGVLVLKALQGRIRKEPPFCIRCGYSLRGLPDDHRCPECGSVYNLAECHLYHEDPLGYRERVERKSWEERKRGMQ